MSCNECSTIAFMTWKFITTSHRSTTWIEWKNKFDTNTSSLKWINCEIWFEFCETKSSSRWKSSCIAKSSTFFLFFDWIYETTRVATISITILSKTIEIHDRWTTRVDWSNIWSIKKSCCNARKNSIEIKCSSDFDWSIDFTRYWLRWFNEFEIKMRVIRNFSTWVIKTRIES